jgi:hypothetical protein
MRNRTVSLAHTAVCERAEAAQAKPANDMRCKNERTADGSGMSGMSAARIVAGEEPGPDRCYRSMVEQRTSWIDNMKTQHCVMAASTSRSSS